MSEENRVDISEARERLSELTRRASEGEVFVVTRYGKPYARIVPSDGVLEDVIVEKLPAKPKSPAEIQRERDELLRGARKRPGD